MSNQFSKSTAAQIAELKAVSARVLERMKLDRLGHRFLLGTHNVSRLRKSLASADRRDLFETTLLTPGIHSAHAEKLNDRFQSRWSKIRQKRLDDWLSIPAQLRRGTPKPSDQAIAADHFRFLTLIDSVEVVDADAALNAAMRMKSELITAVEATKGIWCLGAIEAEVISLSTMRTIRDKDTNAPSEKRKLDVCEMLAADLADTLYRDETSLFLVHFHGIVTAKDPAQFESLRSALLANPQWSKAPRQIEIKKLSEEFFGKAKSVSQNLKHIATYITKGGNDWDGNNIAFRYKVGFSKSEDSYDEVEDTQRNWRRCQILRAEHKLDGIEDAFSMTLSEVAQLAIFIDKLMGANRTRNGYLVCVG